MQSHCIPTNLLHGNNLYGLVNKDIITYVYQNYQDLAIYSNNREGTAMQYLTIIIIYDKLSNQLCGLSSELLRTYV